MKLVLYIAILILVVLVGTAFCVSLVPTNGDPVAGTDFEILARDGRAPYKFEYRIGTNEPVTVEQDEPKLKIPIPAGTQGDTITVKVTDVADETDAEIFFID